MNKHPSNFCSSRSFFGSRDFFYSEKTSGGGGSFVFFDKWAGGSRFMGKHRQHLRPLGRVLSQVGG